MNDKDEDDMAEVRRIRHEISEECDHDVEKFMAYIRAFQEEMKQSGKYRFEKPA